MNVIVANKYKEMLSTLEIDVIKSINGVFTVDEIIDSFSNFFFQRMILDITAIKDYKDLRNIQKLSVNLDMDKVILLLDDSPESESSLYLSRLISMGIYNFTRNKEGIMYLLNHPNSYRDVAHIHQLENLTEQINDRVITKNMRILGIKNLTDHAGATTFIYILKKQLDSFYNVVALEVDKRDFIYFNDPNMISTTSADLAKMLMKYKDVDIILIDLNGYESEDVCNDVLYLLEPSVIKLNKLLMVNRGIFSKLVGKKIVLNKSLLTSRDVLDFEYEAKTKVFYNMPPLDERKNNESYVNPFLAKLGIVKRVKQEGNNKNKIFGLFKF